MTENFLVSSTLLSSEDDLYQMYGERYKNLSDTEKETIDRAMSNQDLNTTIPITLTDQRRSSAIDRINEKYGLRIDSTSTVEKYIVWMAGRNTGAVVHATSRSGAISRARAKKVTGWEGKVDAARLCNDRELAMIKKGTWIRTRANGKETGGAYKFRSWMKN